jgi:hypothetical protein
MVQGPAFFETLRWAGRGGGGFEVGGPHNWDKCGPVTVYVRQGRVVVHAHDDRPKAGVVGPADATDDYPVGSRTWAIRTPVGKSKLRNGRARVTAMAVMTGSYGPQQVTWEDTVTLEGKPKGSRSASLGSQSAPRGRRRSP